jgi:hypothetical protein
MEVLVTTVDTVRDLGDNLTIVTVGDHEVVANKDENGNPRWITGEHVIYVPEGVIVPEDVLKERGYWDDTKGKGLLEGKKGNRVKMRRFAGVESRGLLFKVGFTIDSDNNKINIVERDTSKEEVYVGDDVADFFGITEHVV